MPDNRTVVRVRELRRAMSLPEGLLWRHLRERPGGLEFRRQHPLGPYVLDFYCPSAKLVVEVDGSAHGMGDRHMRDMRRGAWLEAQAMRLMRLPAAYVLEDVERAVAAIVEEARLPLHHASHGPPPHQPC